LALYIPVAEGGLDADLGGRTTADTDRLESEVPFTFVLLFQCGRFPNPGGSARDVRDLPRVEAFAACPANVLELGPVESSVLTRGELSGVALWLYL